MQDQSDNVVHPPQFVHGEIGEESGGGNGGGGTIEDRVEVLEHNVADIKKYLGVGMRMLRSMRKSMITKEDALKSRLTDLKWFIGALVGMVTVLVSLVVILIRSLPTAWH